MNMLRRVTPTLTILFFVLNTFFFVPKAIAADPADASTTTSISDLNKLVRESGVNKNLQEFCDKRKGNQMNLETWYSGKCTDDTFSGEGVGFSDIVILDLAEKINGKNDSSKSFIDTLKEVIETLTTISYNATDEQKQASLDAARQKLFSHQSDGLIGQSGKIIGLLYQNQPASTNSYLAYVSHNLQAHKVIPQALAANSGIGFSTFSPFLTIWMVFRNIAYLALVVFFIVYGFMMMFRVNLGQKTVITVQLAIPKLIVTLLIITFSYAIVGLVYDFMWVLIYFVLYYLASQDIIVFGPHWYPAVAASGNKGIVLSLLINTVISGPAAIFGVLNLIMGGLAAALGTAAGYITAVNFIIGLIIMIAVLVSYAKLIFKLVGAFISVVISLITAPLVLLGNAFPGSTAIGNWFRSIVANLSVFPVTMLLLLFSYLLMVQPLVGICSQIPTAFQTFLGMNPSGGMTWCENLFGVKNLVDNSLSITGVPIISPATFTIAGTTFGNVDARGILALVGVGLLLMAAKYVDIVKDALKVPPFKYGSAITDALKMGVSVNDKWAAGGYKGIPNGWPGDKMRQRYGPNASGDKATLGTKKDGLNMGDAVKNVSDTVK